MLSRTARGPGSAGEDERALIERQEDGIDANVGGQMSAALADADPEPGAEAAPDADDEQGAGVVGLQGVAAAPRQADDGNPQADRHDGRCGDFVEGGSAELDAEQRHGGRSKIGRSKGYGSRRRRARR